MWIVMTSSKKMPSRCWGRYANVAIVQLNQEYAAKDLKPSMISERAKGVLRMIHLGHHNVGSTKRCAFQVALAEAEKRAAELNSMPMIADYASWGGSA